MESGNRRKYYRARIALPISWEVLDDEEKAVVEKGLGVTLLKKGCLPSPIDEYLADAPPGSEEKRIYRCLQLVNNKLNFIIDHLMGSWDERRPMDDLIEISGSGLKFITGDPLSVGDMLRMNLVMPDSFHYQMELLAEAVRVEPEKDHYLVAASIKAIDEESRDAIVQAVFRRQRQEIRVDRDSPDDEEEA
ncbi:MAG: PilZ domain-containing protein [Thermodesulfobacteriota bacterium]